MNETKVLLANVTYEIKTLDEKWVLWIRIASKPALSINKDCSVRVGSTAPPCREASCYVHLQWIEVDAVSQSIRCPRVICHFWIAYPEYIPYADMRSLYFGLSRRKLVNPRSCKCSNWFISMSSSGKPTPAYLCCASVPESFKSA